VSDLVGGARLVEETPDRLLVADQLGAQHLDRGAAMHGDVLGLEDHPHAPLAEGPEQLKVADSGRRGRHGQGQSALAGGVQTPPVQVAG
jgi:hypothetical protein